MAVAFGEPPSCVLHRNIAPIESWVTIYFNCQLSSLNHNTLYDDLICTQIAME